MVFLVGSDALEPEEGACGGWQSGLKPRCWKGAGGVPPKPGGDLPGEKGVQGKESWGGRVRGGRVRGGRVHSSRIPEAQPAGSSRTRTQNSWL